MKDELLNVSEMVDDMRSKGFLKVTLRTLRDRDYLIAPKKTLANYRQYDHDAIIRAEIVFGLELAGVPENMIKELIELGIRLINGKLRNEREEIKLSSLFMKIYYCKRALELGINTIDMIRSSKEAVPILELFEKAQKRK